MEIGFYNGFTAKSPLPACLPTGDGRAMQLGEQIKI
jgi:hypothetical protein